MAVAEGGFVELVVFGLPRAGLAGGLLRLLRGGRRWWVCVARLNPDFDNRGVDVPCLVDGDIGIYWSRVWSIEAGILGGEVGQRLESFGVLTCVAGAVPGIAS